MMTEQIDRKDTNKSGLLGGPPRIGLLLRKYLPCRLFCHTFFNSSSYEGWLQLKLFDRFQGDSGKPVVPQKFEARQLF